MKTVTALDKQINTYLTRLNTKQKRALLTVAETFVAEQDEESKWRDKTFIAEIDKRFAEYESGKIKGITLNELEANAKLSYKNKKAKNK